MIGLIKNNVLPGTFATVTFLFLATYDMDVNSISGLWHTEMWMLYTAVLGINGVLFMIGDNQLTNKLAGLCLIGVLLFPIQGLNVGYQDADIIHYMFAIAFFIIKSLNHRKYDFALIIIGAATLTALGFKLYSVEIIGLYVLMYTGYLKRKNYFRKIRTQLNKRNE